jgi:hypothetical protein
MSFQMWNNYKRDLSYLEHPVWRLLIKRTWWHAIKLLPSIKCNGVTTPKRNPHGRLRNLWTPIFQSFSLHKWGTPPTSPSLHFCVFYKSQDVIFFNVGRERERELLHTMSWRVRRILNRVLTNSQVQRNSKLTWKIWTVVIISHGTFV